MPRVRLGIIASVGAACILGSLTTVGLAWGLSLERLGTRRSATSEAAVLDGGGWYAFTVARPALGVTEVNVRPLNVRVATATFIEPEERMGTMAVGRPPPAWKVSGREPVGLRTLTRLVGFPWPCLWSGDPDWDITGVRPVARLGQPSLALPAWIEKAVPSLEKTRLPTGIIWPGLLANLAVFCGCWALLLLSPRAARRAARTWRGRCLRCGYDLTALPGGMPCPECGSQRARGTARPAGRAGPR